MKLYQFIGNPPRLWKTASATGVNQKEVSSAIAECVWVYKQTLPPPSIHVDSRVFSLVHNPLLLQSYLNLDYVLLISCTYNNNNIMVISNLIVMINRHTRLRSYKIATKYAYAQQSVSPSTNVSVFLCNCQLCGGVLVVYVTVCGIMVYLLRLNSARTSLSNTCTYVKNLYGALERMENRAAISFSVRNCVGVCVRVCECACVFVLL